MNNAVHSGRRELQLEIVEALKKANYNGIAVASTGIGKAWVLIACLLALNPAGRVWYLCDSELNRDKTFKEELIKWGAEKWIDRIEFYCYQTVHRVAGEQVEVCLCDEFDMALTPKYVRAVRNNSFEHLIMVSATLTEEKRKMAEKIRPVVFEVGLQAIEEQGLLNKSRYFEVNYMLTPKENLAYLNYSRTFAKLLDDGKKNQKELEFLKIRRGQFLAKLKSSETVCKRLVKELLKDQESRIIIFCGLSEQADRISEHSYHSKSVNNMLTEFHEGRIRELAVVSKINRGANIGATGPQGAINRTIFEAPTKSATRFLQRSGRGRRLVVGDVLDVYFLIPHFRNTKGIVLPTIVKKWVQVSTKSIDYKPIKYEFKN